MGLVLKPETFSYQRYLTSIRWFYSSPVLINKSCQITSPKQILISVQKTSRIRIIPRTTSLFPKKLSNRIIHEFKHYYHGSKLLYTETKSSFRIIQKIFTGHKLTRRERKQLIRTCTDLFRLVPFSIFIIVPFLEFTLPVFLKIFPNMLPSTFKQIDRQKQAKIQLEITKILQDTFTDLILKSENLLINEEIQNFSLLYSNQLTLDNLNRLQLINLCKFFHLSSIGPNSYLRLKLQLKFSRLKSDDQLIANEGIHNLTIEELQIACYERGIDSVDMNIEHLQLRLGQWIDLHINQSIPILILLLSKSFYPTIYRQNVSDEIPVNCDINRVS